MYLGDGIYPSELDMKAALLMNVVQTSLADVRAGCARRAEENFR